MARKKFRSDVLRSAQAAAEDLHAIGAIDAAEMRRFDATRLAGQAGSKQEPWDDFFDAPGCAVEGREQPQSEPRESL